MDNSFGGIQSVLESALDGKFDIDVLEAGCGSVSHITLGPQARITGIDISQKQLDRNDGLSQKIRGDLQRDDLPVDAFDLVVCWDVLEHLPEPALAVENMIRTAKPGGLILLAFPNLYSAKGLLTKFTPFWFHVWTRRYLYGETEAGTDDHGPFPTFLRRSIGPNAMVNFVRTRDLKVEYFQLYESEMHKAFARRHRFLSMAWSGLAQIVQFASLQRVSARLTDCIILIRKPNAPTGTGASVP
jgi:SAM-dependent methyltransferase